MCSEGAAGEHHPSWPAGQEELGLEELLLPFGGSSCVHKAVPGAHSAPRCPSGRHGLGIPGSLVPLWPQVGLPGPHGGERASGWVWVWMVRKPTGLGQRWAACRCVLRAEGRLALVGHQGPPAAQHSRQVGRWGAGVICPWTAGLAGDQRRPGPVQHQEAGQLPGAEAPAATAVGRGRGLTRVWVLWTAPWLCSAGALGGKGGVVTPSLPVPPLCIVPTPEEMSNLTPESSPE